MIAKASQRGGGQQLATHLLNELENDRVAVLDVRGAVANDLHGAFAEWEATATGTKCQKYLYSLSVNPDPANGALTREQYLDFIARVEQKMGLSDQPRAVVFHVKHGREHAHVIWSRIDHEKMKAVHMAHDRQKLRGVVQEFALEHGLPLPRGLQNNRGLERFNEHARGVSLHEKQQEERTGATKDERRQLMTNAWRQSDSGKGFVRALHQQGFLLARGQRGYVVVDAHGEIHSLARQIEGVKTKEVKARLKNDSPLEQLQEAETVQETLRQRSREQLKNKASDAFQKHAANQWDILKQKQQTRREALHQKHKQMMTRHRTERQALLKGQEKERQALTRKQEREKPKGLKALLGKVTGKQSTLKHKHQQELKALQTKQKKGFKTLVARQNREAKIMNRRFHSLGAVEKREARSLSTALQRRQLISLAQEYRKAQNAPQRTIKPDFARAVQPVEQERTASQGPAPSPAPSLSQEDTLEAIRETGQDIVRPTQPEAMQEQDSLAEAFRRAQKQKEKREQAKDRDRDDPGRTRDRGRGR